MNDRTADQVADRMLDILCSAGRDVMLEALTDELRGLLRPIEVTRRYVPALAWLDRVHQSLGLSGAQLPAMAFLRVLIAAGGDELDQTVFLPTGLQQVKLN